MAEQTFRWTSEGKTVFVYGGTGPVIYLPMAEQEARLLAHELARLGCPAVTLAAVDGLDWNRDLTPWPAPAVYRKGEAFSGGAQACLAWLTGRLIPRVEQERPACVPWRGIAGYSLGGAFALWAAWHSGCFAGAASVSGSLWYPGLADEVCGCAAPAALERVYFSLGDRECRARNPVLQTVQTQTERVYARCRALDMKSVFCLNPGGHFQQPVQRMAAAIAWLAAAEP